ncbi:LAO/AO transport system ATPase [Thecamonas trahens ATCC 50062]|uniref:LAO/AO transport system ATPase n=1 Tax=Thecamonas trahens ATCC 50062 TaxID=461836 RepID=A0A0L0DJQ2_THETB|nr:LAO/AO transport system ATPase [Thecamonas trahens ATCC 50062]KNC51523.1 LAO/AO transport system ATPase [Thecamonas trahens ATCC 50062]|eukprot:XP_013755926.1 LAO/AO transport system ATPase [Thecamonas trahens ATCC 50062]
MMLLMMMSMMMPMSMMLAMIKGGAGSDPHRGLESSRPDHQVKAQELLARLEAAPNPRASGRPSIRLGISGAPGVGKSTFIEAFGMWLIRSGLSLAVLAIDPSSARTGGSILGDRTRMMELAREPKAYIRTTPSSGTLGGVARHTSDAIAVCDAAGFDVILVETVGVGQSEYAVADVVDMFMLLVSPGAGDELQGIKRGVMELADEVVVTKADGDLSSSANIVRAEYRSALKLMHRKYPDWAPPVRTISSTEGRGLDRLWTDIGSFFDARIASGDLLASRARQRKAALWAVVQDELLRAAKRDAAAVATAEAGVEAGTLSVLAGARRILAATGIDSEP